MDGAAAAALDSSDLSRDSNDLWRDSDAALAARASRGDARAFERLHARWAARVERFAVSRLGSREDAGLPRPVTRESAEAEGRTV